MPDLYPEDQQRVKSYLERPENQVERENFKPMRLLLIIFVVLLILTGISYLVASNHGLI